MKRYFIALALLACVKLSFGQLYFSRTGFIGFYSKTSLEDVKGENNQGYILIDFSQKTIAMSSLVKGFVFPKELMQEHFNENYIESDKFPKATFSGSFSGDVDISKDGVYAIKVKGMLSLHNVSKEVETLATLEVKGATVDATAQFIVTPADFNIAIPALVKDKIAKAITINVHANCQRK